MIFLFSYFEIQIFFNLLTHTELVYFFVNIMLFLEQ